MVMIQTRTHTTPVYNLLTLLLVGRCFATRRQLMKNEGIECLQGELLLVKLQNASCEALHGKVCRFFIEIPFAKCSVCRLFAGQCWIRPRPFVTE